MNTELNPLLPVLVTKHNGCGYIAAGCTVHAIPLEIADALIARDAAVAELIEAVRLYRRARFLNAKSEHGDRAAIARELGLDEYSSLLTIQCEAFDRVETALARVGDAS